jgi:hypothetical protein
MPLSGVKATTDYPPDARYRERRAPPDRPTKASPASLAPGAKAGEDYDAAFYARRFKTDLSQLKVFDGAEESAPPPPDPEGDSALMEFFGHLSVLLVAVRSGDISRAQAAADALELDALVERNVARRPGGSVAMLDDLVAMLSAAQSRDEGAARLAAKGLAGDFQNAVAPPSGGAYAEAAEDGGAAYDTLASYLGGAGA